LLPSRGENIFWIQTNCALQRLLFEMRVATVTLLCTKKLSTSSSVPSGEQVCYFKQTATWHNEWTNITVWITDCEKNEL